MIFGKLPRAGFLSTAFYSEKMLIDMLESTPNSQWFDPNDRSTWFEDSKLTIQATDPTRVKYLKNKVGNNYLEINDTALTVSPYNGLYTFELDGTEDARGGDS